jgi:hypothetical protein
VTSPQTPLNRFLRIIGEFLSAGLEVQLLEQRDHVLRGVEVLATAD